MSKFISSKIFLQTNRCCFGSSFNFHLLTQTNNIYNNRLRAFERTKHTSLYKNEKEKFRTFVVQRYIQYVNNYTKVLENRFPAAMRVYRVFSVGIKDFLRDLKSYISLRIKYSKDKGFKNMTRQDIELYYKMPSDMWRIAPVLILSAIPFGNYIIFPLAFLKPRKLLCSHFWSIQQRLEFSTLDLQERLRHNRPVFRSLQKKMESLPDSEVKRKWQRVIALLGSGVHPTPKEVLDCKELFTKEPFSLNSLTYNHMGHLLKMHGIKSTFFRRKKLRFRAFILLELDKAIIKEGGVDILTMESLRNACLMRGLNGSHLSNHDMRVWLQQWLNVSQQIDYSCSALLLHCPIFFAYNHPQNWVLIY
ncbi:LETM1 domain-containing protein 1 [Aricia agestis]|uniref:LETM1 domain-containing protein 1 n=1 Tax=Aricia agestis TaxID=91739 RepID=UPI001C20900E|nr:LETM1 domain-containing protein 1 [Aricia agestis]